MKKFKLLRFFILFFIVLANVLVANSQTCEQLKQQLLNKQAEREQCTKDIDKAIKENRTMGTTPQIDALNLKGTKLGSEMMDLANQYNQKGCNNTGSSVPTNNSNSQPNTLDIVANNINTVANGVNNVANTWIDANNRINNINYQAPSLSKDNGQSTANQIGEYDKDEQGKNIFNSTGNFEGGLSDEDLGNSNNNVNNSQSSNSGGQNSNNVNNSRNLNNSEENSKIEEVYYVSNGPKKSFGKGNLLHEENGGVLSYKAIKTGKKDTATIPMIDKPLIRIPVDIYEVRIAFENKTDQPIDANGYVKASYSVGQYSFPNTLFNFNGILVPHDSYEKIILLRVAEKDTFPELYKRFECKPFKQ